MTRLTRLTLLCTFWASAFLLASPARGQTTLSSGNCPGTGCVVFPLNGQGSVGVQVTGTFTGTLTFQGTVDNANYASLPMTPIAGGATVTTTTGTGIWSASVAGLASVRVNFTSFSSGSAVVSAVLSTARLTPNPTSVTTGGACTNQAATGVAAGTGAPTCTTLTSAYVDTSIAKTGTDVNTSNQVTATHLSAALPFAQGGTNATSQNALTHANPAAPTARSSSGSFIMVGLGAAASPCTVTPVATGRVIFTITGSVVNNTNATTVSVKMAESTGSAPANNAAATGTVISGTYVADALTSALSTPFSITSIQTGLALSTAVWFDLQLQTSSTNTGQIANVDCTAEEV